MINNPFSGVIHARYMTAGRQLGAIARLSPDYRPIIAAILTDNKQK